MADWLYVLAVGASVGSQCVIFGSYPYYGDSFVNSSFLPPNSSLYRYVSLYTPLAARTQNCVSLIIGGANVAKIVAAAAAKHLTPVSLELGGAFILAPRFHSWDPR